MVGGSSQINQVLPTLEMYDPAASEGAAGTAFGGGAAGGWQLLAGMAQARSALAAASLSGRLYAIGGQAGPRIFRCDGRGARGSGVL